MQPDRSRFDKSPMNQGESKPPSRHRGIPRQRGLFRCPHCSKQYTTSTWLGNHIKVKHSTRNDKELADEVHNHRAFVESPARRPQSLQESYSSALAKDLRNMSSQLKEVLSLIDDVVPVLLELGEASSCSIPTDRSYLQKFKRRASSPDLREGQAMKRQVIPAYSSGVHRPQYYESGRINEAEPRNNNPATTFVDDQRFATTEIYYSAGVPRHTLSRHSHRPQPLRLPDPAAYLPTLNSELPQQPLQTASFLFSGFRDQEDNGTTVEQATEYQHKSPSLGHLSVWSPLATTTPVIDAQLSQSLQEPNQQQSRMQTMRHTSDLSPFRFQGVDSFDSLFQECCVPNPLAADLSNEASSSGQLVEDSRGSDDMLSHAFDI